MGRYRRFLAVDLKKKEFVRQGLSILMLTSANGDSTVSPFLLSRGLIFMQILKTSPVLNLLKTEVRQAIANKLSVETMLHGYREFYMA